MRSLDITTLFCTIDDFCQKYQSELEGKILPDSKIFTQRVKCRLYMSEIMTILIGFQLSGAKCFKWYFLSLLTFRKSEFPNLVSYSRIVELIPGVLIPLVCFLNQKKGNVTGISFVDSTSIAVCKNRRINRNKVFSGLATRGKTTMGWFFGFKLHVIVNENGELLSFSLSPGNQNDRSSLEKLTKGLFGKLFADKGYIGKELFKKLYSKNIKLITGIKSNMENRLMEMSEKILLKKRFIIETIFDQLKNIYNMEHSRHRSPINFLVNVVTSLIAYTLQEKKPSIK